MKFVILTDIHLGPENYHNGILRKINKDAKLFLSNFVKEMNTIVRPQFVAVLGDLIQDDNSEADEENIRYVVNSLEKLICPAYYIAGNHDLKNISEGKLAELFKQKRLNYSFNSSDLHFVVLFSKKISEGNIKITKDQIDWLKKDLSDSRKKCIVFVHHGLADQNLKGNPWFEGKPGSCLIDNRKNIRSVLEKSGKVISVFNSHLHWDKKNIHHLIPYFTIQSLTENEADKGIPSEAYAVVNIVNNEVAVNIRGNYPKEF